MESAPQKRKNQKNVTSKRKSKQRNDSARQTHVAETGVNNERPQRRGRPKNAAPTVSDKVAAMSISSPGSRVKKETVQTRPVDKVKTEAYIMKLFDRRLDISDYTDETPLYPICRAWLAGQPHDPNAASSLVKRPSSPEEREDNGGEILSKIRSGELQELHAMPKPKKADIPKVPQMSVSKTMKDSSDLVKLQEEFKDKTKEEMLSQHLIKWKQIKKDWIQHTRRYQQRNEVNFKILKELFKQ